MTLKNGTGQACAACKYQRRRCTPECLLAPFFPADDPRTFRSVHKLFGVKNIQNLLKDLDPTRKAIAVKSIKYHADMRDKYPVYGCLVDIQHLNYQIQMAEEELQAVLQQLVYYQQQYQREVSPTDDYVSQLQLGMAPPGNTSMQVVPQDNPTQYNAMTAVPFSNNSNVDYNTNMDDKEKNNVDSMWIQQIQQTYSSNNNDSNSIIIQPPVSTSQPLPMPQETTQDYNEMHPFFDNVDDRQSYVASKEAFESSFDSSIKDSRQPLEQIAENELKNAAACFSLTSVN
ncbi:hypothetical protein CDL12_29645 [Handroanthus impetiginosus]|uniref:LOB domain-containing protein n=1 Tax=Handroanthus impetiginosus TaxID=429701 RepID=A0A2G9FXT8_9LAMI|nr:hypothetical protein CDL12_29645 [Handroanthus impetiginosus]